MPKLFVAMSKIPILLVAYGTKYNFPFARTLPEYPEVVEPGTVYVLKPSVAMSRIPNLLVQ
jgi:hypothetical protein